MSTTTQLTPTRIAAAFVVAVLADLIQIPLTLLLMTGVLAIPCEVANVLVGVVTLAVIIALLGVHWTLLAVFAFEMVPVLDGIPTWTGTVGLLVWLRKQEEAAAERRTGAERPIQSARTLTLVRGEARVPVVRDDQQDREGA